MATEIKTLGTPKKELPQLIKQSSTYKLVVPKKVEEKIRYMLRKFPSTEWSGVLFYNYEGSFEENNLKIICEDIYPMDLGNATFTNFCMNEDVASYMAENIELFDCQLGLCHSHHCMGTGFSGTDINTLQEEGNERNCFVSLIVNNAGTYNAAITRKMKAKHEVTVKDLGQSYEFFGDGIIKVKKETKAGTTQVVDKEVIQYFMLEVEREEVPNTLGWLDDRFDEIVKRKKEKDSSVLKVPSQSSFADDSEFWNWVHDKNSTLPITGSSTKEGEEDSEEDFWHPDPTIIHCLVSQMITCSLIIDNTGIDLEQWIKRHMEKKYKEVFNDSGDFHSWAEFIVEFQIQKYNEPSAPDYVYADFDFLQREVAAAICDELQEYPTNPYIQYYIEILERYIYDK